MGNNALIFDGCSKFAVIEHAGRFGGKSDLVAAQINKLFLNLTPKPVFIKTGNFYANKVCIAVKLALGLY